MAKGTDSAALRQRLVDLDSAPLRVRARSLADGIHGGAHRAERKGAGIEFAGHRPYTLGDDLRHLDRHALLRHGRLMVREFHTDTERPVHLIVDASPSMDYRSDDALFKRPRQARDVASRPSKLGLASLIAAAIAMIARRTGDPVGLSLVGETEMTFRPRLGGETLERLLAALEEREASAKSRSRVGSDQGSSPWESALGRIAHQLPRGTSIFFFSDFLDFERADLSQITDLATRRRTLTCLLVLDPAEVEFPFEGALRLRDDETGTEIETDAEPARTAYLEALHHWKQTIRQELSAKGARLVSSTTTDHPAWVLREVLELP